MVDVRKTFADDSLRDGDNRSERIGTDAFCRQM